VQLSKSEKLIKLMISEAIHSPTAPEYIKMRVKKILSPAGGKNQLTLLLTSN
jgi:hypothetical protein